MAYANKTDVAIITNKNVTDVKDLFLSIADNSVNSLLNRTFGDVLDCIEYYDTSNRNVFFENDIGSLEFPLSNWPVTSVDKVEIINRSKSNSIITENVTALIEDDGYFVDNGAKGCIIKLSGSSSIPLGLNSLKVTYKWGYPAVPDEIVDYANYFASSLIEAGNFPTNESGKILTEIEIGRYREKYANPSTVFNYKYGTLLKELQQVLVNKYKFWD